MWRILRLPSGSEILSQPVGHTWVPEVHRQIPAGLVPILLAIPPERQAGVTQEQRVIFVRVARLAGSRWQDLVSCAQTVRRSGAPAFDECVEKVHKAFLRAAAFQEWSRLSPLSVSWPLAA